MNSAAKIECISDAQKFFSVLYTNEDRNEDYIYGYLARNSGYLCKHIWQDKVGTIDFVRAVSWLLALCAKTGIDLEDAYIRRFPGVCPYCISSPCECRNTKKSPVNYIPAYKIEEELSNRADGIKNVGQKITFDLASGQSDRIYPNNLIIWEYGGPWRHLVKIQEEVSEIHEAMSGVISKQRPISMLAEEVADAFAWMMSAWRIIFPEKSFQDEFINYYIKGCPVCFATPCVCGKRSERANEFVDSKVFKELREQLEILAEELGYKDVEIEELKSSLKAAEVNQSEPVARNALQQTRAGLEKIEGSVDFAERNTKKAASIAASISKLLENLPF